MTNCQHATRVSTNEADIFAPETEPYAKFAPASCSHTWQSMCTCKACALHVTMHPSNKTKTIFQENQKLRMEFAMLQMENESLKLEVAKYVSASQRRRGDGHDSGEFNTFGETSIDAEGRVTGLLGSLQVPFLLNQEVETREERMKTYFRNKISELKTEREELKSKTEHYVKEVCVS